MAVITNIETRTPLFITAGVTSGFTVGGNSFTNVVSDDNGSLANWDFTVDIRSQGKLKKDVEFEFDGEETITILIDGYQIGNGEVWILEFQPRQSNTPIPSTVQTQYTNGFDLAKVMSALMNRTRWRQPTMAEFPFTLSSLNVWPDDDQYSPVFESFHKIVTPHIVWQVQEDNDIDEDQFNALLQNLQKDAILKCLKTVFSKTEHLERKLMFERFGRGDYLNVNDHKFVGVRITPARDFGKSVQIDNVALKFDSDVTFNLYLFHDTQPLVPVTSLEVSAVANEQTVVNINHVLSYTGHSNKGGCYYLGYFQDDLGSAKAYNEVIQEFNPMFNFGCVSIELLKSGSGVDINQLSFTMKSHGFNIQLSAFRDFTQNIITNNYLFDNMIGLQVAADVIELIQNTRRTNKDERISQELSKQLYSDLNIAQTTEEVPFGVGLKARIQKEAHRVRCEFYQKNKITSITHDTDRKDIYGVPAPLIDVFKY
jgi:hypothetical protein